MAHIHIDDLKNFCENALKKEGMSEGCARTVAEVLTETDAYGTHSHGTKNLHNYIRKLRAGGADIKGEPAIIADGPAFAVIDAGNTLGMIPSVMAMELACRKAEESGVALVTVRNSCHFGAAGYYANMAAAREMIGLVFSNVDPNMTAPGARSMMIGNNPLAYAAPALKTPSIFLDIALSNVASLKVIQARRDGQAIPDSWIVDKDGLPTTDPGHYPEEGAMQPMAAHKGYGLAVMVDLLTGILSGGATSMSGEVVSWVFELEKANRVSHTFMAINPAVFGVTDLADRAEGMAGQLRNAPKAKGSDRIYTPGEMEWERHARARQEGIDLPADVQEALKGLADELMIDLPLF